MLFKCSLHCITTYQYDIKQIKKQYFQLSTIRANVILLELPLQFFLHLANISSLTYLWCAWLIVKWCATSVSTVVVHCMNLPLCFVERSFALSVETIEVLVDCCIIRWPISFERRMPLVFDYSYSGAWCLASWRRVECKGGQVVTQWCWHGWTMKVQKWFDSFMICNWR